MKIKKATGWLDLRYWYYFWPQAKRHEKVRARLSRLYPPTPPLPLSDMLVNGNTNSLSYRREGNRLRKRIQIVPEKKVDEKRRPPPPLLTLSGMKNKNDGSSFLLKAQQLPHLHLHRIGLKVKALQSTRTVLKS